MLLSLLLTWALVTGVSAVAGLLFLACDEWQVRSQAIAKAEGAADLTAADESSERQAAAQAA